MTTRGIPLEANLDISDVLRGFDRISREARGLGGRIGGIGGGIGGTVAAGAGLGAGLAVFEQVFERLFELFENTPVFQSFTDALDAVLMAAGPVVGVLLQELTPSIIALTPAIAALVPAITPMIQLFGVALQGAIQALTPAITLLGNGLAVANQAVRDFVISGINFVVDQINRLPWVDIQLEISNFDTALVAMEAQIRATGDAAGTGPDTAAGRIAAMGGAIQGATGAVTATIDPLSASAIAFSSVQTEADLARERLAAAREALGLVNNSIDASTISVGAWDAAIEDASFGIMGTTDLTRQYIEENQRLSEGISGIITPINILQDEMDETFSATDSLGKIMAAAVKPMSNLDARIAEMTATIQDAQKEAELTEQAFAALPPEMQAAAMALGLFGSAISAVAATAAAAAERAQEAARRAAVNPGAVHSPSGRFTGSDPTGGREGGSGTIVAVRDLGGTLFYMVAGDRTEYNATLFGREAEARAFLNAQQQRGASGEGPSGGQGPSQRSARGRGGMDGGNIVVNIDGTTISTVENRNELTGVPPG